MRGLGRRLDRLEANAPAAETPAWLRRMEAQAETPAEDAALWIHLYHRAARRRAAERGVGVAPLPPTGGETDEAVAAEFAAMRALAAAHGAEDGVGRWFAEEAAWPDLGWPGGEAGLAYYVEQARRELHDLRACPTLAPWRARTGWREGMTPDEEAAFARRLHGG